MPKSIREKRRQKERVNVRENGLMRERKEENVGGKEKKERMYQKMHSRFEKYVVAPVIDDVSTFS